MTTIVYICKAIIYAIMQVVTAGIAGNSTFGFGTSGIETSQTLSGLSDLQSWLMKTVPHTSLPVRLAVFNTTHVSCGYKEMG